MICLESILLFNKIHRNFLNAVKHFLQKIGQTDLNPTQAIILYSMGSNTLRASEVLTHYQGSNPSYNIKKMVNGAYIVTQENPLDRRLLLVSLSKKGKQFHEQMNQFLMDQEKRLSKEGFEAFSWNQLMEHGEKLEKFWRYSRYDQTYL